METRSDLKEWLLYEHKLLWGEQSRKQYILEMLKCAPQYRIGRYMRYLRIAGYYYIKRNKNIAYAFLYLWFCRRKNILGKKLGIELEEYSFERGLTIYHTNGIVVNGFSRIGKNCKLHGNNCIGNNGLTAECPRLGDNVRLGVGAKVIGGVEYIIKSNLTSTKYFLIACTN